ncbi:hypothetical protein CW368_11920 [Actinomycetales bacterium SN12]|nr:hypothetical protein CW368_11920 [Actinomycetales bacterium SN12]
MMPVLIVFGAGTSEHDTIRQWVVGESPEIVELRQVINDMDTESSRLERAHHLEQRERMDRYGAVLAARESSFPTPTQLEAFDPVATFVQEGTTYGDFLGYPRRADMDAGRTPPIDVHFSAADARMNIYAHAPYKAGSASRAWEFSDADVEVLRAELEWLSLKVLTHWIHDDSVAFVIAGDKR